ncbi:MAG: multi-sensor hybrid histidine kinase [Verrucomicrobiales bacterium]|nr:multi-sensor hybrid histidine kinase [Verrucomicrobiales bacterium]
MSFNTALCFIFSGFPLLSWGLAPLKGWKGFVYYVCASVVITISFITFSQYLTHANFGIDLFFHSQTSWAELGTPIGRMVPSTAVNMTLLGLVMLLGRHGKLAVFGHFLAVIVGLQAFLALLGYFYNVPELRNYGHYIAMSLPTATSFCLLSLAILFSQPNRGFMSVVSSQSIAGAVARRLIPMVIIIPPVIGYLRGHGERLGWFGRDLGTSILVVIHVFLFSGLILAVLKRLATIEQDRNVALDGQRKMAAESQTLFELSAVGQSQADPVTGRLLRVNAQLSLITGFSNAELLRMTFSDLTHPEDREADFADFQRMVRGELKERKVQKRYVRKDGQTVWVQVNVVLLRHSNGNPLTTMAVIQDITAQKKAEEALESENAALELERSRLRAVLEALPVGVFISDHTGKLIQANQAGRTIWGGQVPLTDRPEKYASDYKAWWPNGRLVTSQEWGLARALAEGKPCGAEEMEIETQDGTHKTILNYAMPILQANGQVTGGVAVNVDISGRKKAEEELKESSRLQQLRAEVAEVLAQVGPEQPVQKSLQAVTQFVVDRMGAAFTRIWTLDAQETTLELKASAGMYTHLDGAHARIAVGQYKIGLIVQEKEAHLTNHVLGDARVHNQKWAKEHGLISFAGYPLQVKDQIYGVIGLFSRHPLSQNAFDTLAAVAALLGQTLARKKAESAFKQSENALRERNERSGVLAETTGQLLSAEHPVSMVHSLFDRVAPVLKLDAYFNFLVTGEGSELRLDSCAGIPEEVSRTIQRLQFGQAVCGTVAENRKAWVVTHVQESLEPKVELIRSFGLRAYACFPLNIHGRLIGTLSFASRSRDSFDEEDLLFMRTLSDYVAIAQERANYLQELEQRVAERTARLQESIGDLEHFSYSITHDMRAPLRAMQGFSRLLLGPMGEQPAVRQEFLTRIAEASDRMDKLIRDALDYSKVAKSELPLAPVDTDALVRSLIASQPDFQRPLAEIWIEGHLPPVKANEIGLAQCFSNLLENAVKFVKLGERPKVKIRAETRCLRRTEQDAASKQGGSDGNPIKRVRIWVEDNGVGIPQESQGRIFQIFHRLSTNYDGTGIGLALVRKVVDRMGGKVGVESEPGKGSYFWVDLAGID